jgi:hypothetical protein
MNQARKNPSLKASSSSASEKFPALIETEYSL